MTERMTAAEYRAALSTGKSKYKNIPVKVDGIRFHSKREAWYYFELKIREQAGEVSALQLQRRYQFFAPNGSNDGAYVADFCFWDHVADRFRVVDVKGFITQAFREKQKRMRNHYGIEVEVVT